MLKGKGLVAVSSNPRKIGMENAESLDSCLP